MGNNVFQMIRIDFPAPPARREEDELEKNCRLELPGVYFGFNSAELEPASEPALTGVATLLQHHPDWSFTIEGHTDSIGTPLSNAKLSAARAEAVRTALIERHQVAPERLATAGFGATRPRESNSTIEGRARNRRVELARDCGTSH
jgi:outer membrane protein OmpA-like peptidoglycan-associated protein